MKRALLYVFLAIVLLYAVRALLYEGLHRTEAGEFAKLRTVFEEKNNFDVVVIGSSRAECQFYNPIIDSITGLSSYNLGMTGATMPLIAATLEAYLENSAPPKYVILNIDLHSLGDNTDTVYLFPRYFAFLDNEKLYEGLVARDKRFLYFKWLPFYSMPYYSNRYLSNSVRGWLNQPTKFDSDYEQGFAPSIRDTSWGDMDTAKMKVVDLPVPHAVWESTDHIREVCKANNCTLILVVSPLFHRQETCIPNYTKSFDAFKAYAAKHQLAFIDFGHDSIRFDKTMYADPAHLGKEGAKQFTRRFSTVLMQYIRQ